MMDDIKEMTRADFASDQEVRWCPGCGDYSILANLQKALARLNIPREKYVFVSGIGCSSRFPYYMNTYGMHTIHGRAPAVASGIKISKPELCVWVITGDGDGLSIGTNHFVHAMRRNLNINIILFNNRIYGLTKGQYSPTSEYGKITKSSPYGTIENPINPIRIAIAAEATFVARTIDVDGDHLTETLEKAALHKGVSFVEIYQNCVIFNDGAFSDFTHKKVREDNILYLEHGKPLLYGNEKDKGICIQEALPKTVDVGDCNSGKGSLAVHDETRQDQSWAYTLSQMQYPDFPVPIGVFRCIEKPTYENLLNEQIRIEREKQGEPTLESLFLSKDTWIVE